MRKALAVGRKEFRQIARDRRSLLVLLFVPAFFLLLYGYALNFDVQHIRLAVEDDDGTMASRKLISDFVNSGYFDLAAAVTRSSQRLNPGRDRHVDMGIGLLRVHAREQADGEAAPLLRAARGGFHHASQPAAQEHRTPLRQEASDRPRPLRLLRRAPAAADHRDEDASHQRAWRPAAAQ